MKPRPHLRLGMAGRISVSCAQFKGEGWTTADQPCKKLWEKKGDPDLTPDRPHPYHERRSWPPYSQGGRPGTYAGFCPQNPCQKLIPSCLGEACSCRLADPQKVCGQVKRCCRSITGSPNRGAVKAQASQMLPIRGHACRLRPTWNQKNNGKG